VVAERVRPMYAPSRSARPWLGRPADQLRACIMPIVCTPPPMRAMQPLIRIPGQVTPYHMFVYRLGCSVACTARMFARTHRRANGCGWGMGRMAGGMAPLYHSSNVMTMRA